MNLLLLWLLLKKYMLINIKKEEIKMVEILKFISGLGLLATIITPATLIIGIINSIKKTKNESVPYTIMAIISAYLIIIPIIYCSLIK